MTHLSPTGKGGIAKHRAHRCNSRPGLGANPARVGGFFVYRAERELARHIEGALNLGITPDEIIEIMIQVAYYVGWPAGHNGAACGSRGVRAQQSLQEFYSEIDSGIAPRA